MPTRKLTVSKALEKGNKNLKKAAKNLEKLVKMHLSQFKIYYNYIIIIKLSKNTLKDIIGCIFVS